MKVLLLTPVAQGSGETITALHLAEGLAAAGDRVRFLASPFARRFLDPAFPGAVDELTDDGAENRRRWDRAVADFAPDAVVFADYPLMHFATGTCPLAGEPGWVESLEELEALPVTLDHFGFAQAAGSGCYLGPPHLGIHYQAFPELPERMRVLLPCPMHQPGPLPGRRGEPFRYWRVPLARPAAADEVRRRHLDGGDGLLVFHAVPTWAWRAAGELGLELYRHLPRILDRYLRDAPLPVTVVSLNNGELLAQPAGARTRFVNLGPVPAPEVEALLFAADLMLTENKLSITMGKAVCGLRPCAALRNGYRLGELVERLDGVLLDAVQAMERRRLGAVYPFEVFPTVVAADLEAIGLYRGNRLASAFAELEIFGGEPTAEALVALLADPGTRRALGDRQRGYVDALAGLDDGAAVLRRMVDEEGGG